MILDYNIEDSNLFALYTQGYPLWGFPYELEFDFRQRSSLFLILHDDVSLQVKCSVWLHYKNTMTSPT